MSPVRHGAVRPPIAILTSRLQSAIETRLRSIRETERLNFWLTLFLTFLALVSALLVAGLGRQMRLLAAEAMRRRQEAEREKLVRLAELELGGLALIADGGLHRDEALQR